MKLLYESREALIILFNDYSSIAYQSKYKTTHGKGIPGISARVACDKLFGYLNLKILISKQMIQRLQSTCTSKSRQHIRYVWLRQLVGSDLEKNIVPKQ